MNKIYKVVWSKVKHCYVVTSELAKRHGKGCGARSLRMAAVSMGVAAALIGGIGGSVAEAADAGRMEEGGSGTFPAENGRYYSAENLYWNPSTKSVTVTAGSPVSIEPLSSTEPVPTVSTETEAKRYIIGNIVYQNSSITTNVLVDAEKAIFKFEGGTLKRYYTNPGMIAQQYQQHIEGYSDTNKDVSGYSVTVDMGSSGSGSKDEAYGGYSQFGKASDNSVTVKSGVLRRVYGGYSFSAGATGNSVTMTGGTVSGEVEGGETYSGSADAEGNEVTISGGTVNYSVLGAFVDPNSTGNAKNNKVTVSGTTVVDTDVNGAQVAGGGNAIGNSVTIDGGTVKKSVAGASTIGYAGNAGSAEENGITMKGGSVGNLYGGYSQGESYDDGEYYNGGAVTHNTVTISGGSVGTNVIGGESYSVSAASGDANNNTVTISAETGETTIGNNVIGGRSKNNSGASGNANSNVVAISGGTVSGKVYGGYTDSGTAVNANNNEVTVSGGTINGGIYGGYGYSAATGNTVEIKDGTIGKSDADVGFTVFGGYAKTGDSNQNNVIITGGTVNGYVVGGYAYFDAAGNTVTLSNCTINGEVHGSSTIDGETKNNTVNLTGKVSGLDGKYSGVYGIWGRTDDKGNELHIGGTKDGSITGAWQGMTGDVVTNKISSVVGFESIVYHSVKWDENVPALEVNTLYNVDAIDITKLAFDSSGTGTMALLKATSDDSDLSSIKLNYSGGTGVDITTDGVVLSGGTPQTEKDGVNGVKLTTQTDGEKVFLAADSKAINYSKGATTVSAITFGTFDIDKGARDLTGSSFATGNTVDAAGLTFKDTTSALKKNDSITLVTNATGVTTKVDGETVKTIAIDYTDDRKIKFAATATGNVTSAGGAVKYTVGSVAVSDIDVSKWNGTTSAVTASWDTKEANVNTAGISVTGLNPGDTKTILTAASGSDFSNVTLDAGAWQKGGDITDTAVNGVEIAGTTTGGGVKVSDDKSRLVYQQDKKNVTGITLGAFNASKAARSFGSGDDLRSAKINADGFSLSNLDAAQSSVVVLDATNAIAGSDGATLKEFATQNIGDAVAFEDKIEGTILTFGGTHQDTLEQNSAKTQIVYKMGDKKVSGVAFDDSVTWDDSKAYYTNEADADGRFAYTFSGAADVDATNLKVTGKTDKLLKADGSSSMTLLSATGMTAGAVTDQSDANKEASKVAVNYKDAQGIAFTAEAKGEVKAETGAVKYNINEVKLTDVDLSAWTGSESAVPDTWTAEDGSVKVTTGSFAAPEVAAGASKNILTAGGAFFADANISGANKYDEANGKAFSETQDNVTVSGKQARGVAASEDSKSLVYKVGIKKADTVTLGAVDWKKGATLLDGSREYDYANVADIDAGSFDVAYGDGILQTVAAGDSMTLLKANDTLKAIVNEEKAKSYSIEPVAGVTVDAAVTGKLANSGNNVTFTAAENKAGALTFGKVEWTGDTPLIDHGTTLANVSFDGATVDTSAIDFHNEMYIEAGQTTTLVSDFGGTPGAIRGDTYLVGTAYEGEGAAEMEGGNLVFRTRTAAGVSEQTHKAVMASVASMALLATGNEYVGKVLEDLGELKNAGKDGVSTAAAIGGGTNRYETGSHVNTRTWNAAVGVGAKRSVKGGSLEYGIFGEYGKGNYTLHSNAGQSDGDAHYAGGGVLAKWTSKHDVYTEAGFRLGRMSDNAKNLLYGPGGAGYGYNVHANYYGAHIGLGKIFKYDGGRSLDVYGKYFYTKRDGVEFDAVQHYHLDSVASSILRIGARYGTNDKKWNWYGGLAYEYEFDGKAEGEVNGTAIRSASVKGSSVRGEIGMRMDATKENPWQTDISLYGYGGKHRGFGGNVNVAYTF